MRRSLPREHQQRPRTGKYKGIIKAQKKESVKRTYDHLQEISTEEEEELILFSKRATADGRDEIILAMDKTFQNRRNWIFNTTPGVMDILERYPRFRDTPALAQLEFKLLFPDATSKLISTWETRFVQGILHIAKISRLPKIKALMEELYSPASNNDGQYTPSDGKGKRSLYAFLAAVYLLPSNSGKRTSLTDAVQYFLVTKPHGTSVASFLEDEQRQPVQKRTQHYLLGVGNKRSPSQFFVIIDKQAIQCSTGPDITQAVDVMFKLHYIFNLHYAAELKSFYAFLEHYVYGIGIAGSAIPVRAKDLMSNITAVSSKEVVS
nr:uncharacterized protein LOC129261213 [Lytechinus pictus]